MNSHSFPLPSSSTPPPPKSALGLGCVTFGREIDAGASFAMMDHALKHGIVAFDTASAYGGGASETIVGQWLVARGNRGRVRLATKILPPYSPAAINAAVETSLNRLQVTTMDTLYLHRWDESAADESVLRALDQLIQNGRVGGLGASNFTAGQLERVFHLQANLGLARFGVLQNIHNFAVRGIDDAILAFRARTGGSIVAYSPLGAGFLTGKHAGGVQPGSRFEIIPGHQGVYFNDLARGRLDRLQQVAEQTGRTVIELALAWALHQPQIDTVLVGGRTPAHLDQALRAREFDPSNLLRELDAS